MRQFKPFLSVLFFFQCFLLRANIDVAKLKLLAVYPFETQISVDSFTEFYHRNFSENQFSFQKSFPEHWYVYKMEIRDVVSDIVLEAPDYQVNNLKVYLIHSNFSYSQLLSFGDEIPLSEYSQNSRVSRVKIGKLDSGIYLLFVQYDRSGVKPNLLLKINNIENSVQSWRYYEVAFGVVYGVLLAYCLYSLVVLYFRRTPIFWYFSMWVIMNTIYYSISSGHFKFFLNINDLNFISGIRQSSVVLAIYAIQQFSIYHYRMEYKLRYFIWYGHFIASLTVILNIYTLTSKSIFYEGYEYEFLLVIRLVILIFVILQFYLPTYYYIKHKQFSFFLGVLLISLVNLITFVIQQNFFQEVDYEFYSFISASLFATEVFVIAYGTIKYTVLERERFKNSIIERSQLVDQQNKLQFISQENERRKIAIDLHDDVLNRLSINFMLFRGGYIEKDKMLQALNDIRFNINRYSDGFFFEMKSGNENIETLIQVMRKTFPQLEIIFRHSPSETESIESFIRTQLLRIIQEFVKNAVVHGKASKVDIDLNLKNSEITLSLLDNGVGFDSSKTPKGLGTDGVQYRVFSLNGKLRIWSSPNIGVSWTIIIPLQNAHLGEFQHQSL